MIVLPQPRCFRFLGSEKAAGISLGHGPNRNAGHRLHRLVIDDHGGNLAGDGHVQVLAVRRDGSAGRYPSHQSLPLGIVLRIPVLAPKHPYDDRSTAQEADSVGPVPVGGFPQEIAQGPYEATRIQWR